ncbi:MAG: hypothetical protein K0S71_2882 [Clostridia bacterium]|jgi:hypothetical protein|nr:hypothetical protein [Clostridia bacterium]
MKKNPYSLRKIITGTSIEISFITTVIIVFFAMIWLLMR